MGNNVSFLGSGQMPGICLGFTNSPNSPRQLRLMSYEQTVRATIRVLLALSPNPRCKSCVCVCRTGET